VSLNKKTKIPLKTKRKNVSTIQQEQDRQFLSKKSEKLKLNLKWLRNKKIQQKKAKNIRPKKINDPLMKNICFYFQVHQPFRLKHFRFFDISQNQNYFDDKANHDIMRKVAEKCYLPANHLMLDLIKKYKGKFKISYSISGIALDQFELYAPDVLESFKKLAKTGCVEFLAETYAHSLASVISPEEFKRQVKQHEAKIEQLFGQKPKVFRNTELIYSNQIGAMVSELGYKTMITEGADKVLTWQSPNHLYQSYTTPGLNLLLKNYKLSDDIAFRFSHREWSEWPLTSEKFVGWLNNIQFNPEIVNIFMDYETFGEHQ